MMEEKFDIGRMLLHTLRQAGVQEVFGIPGDFVLPSFKVIEESSTWSGNFRRRKSWLMSVTHCLLPWTSKTQTWRLRDDSFSVCK
jgi:predicted metalloprotease